MAVAEDVRVHIVVDADIVQARGEGRALASRLGFARTDATLIATAISEIGRNILHHAGRGEVSIAEAADDHLLGIEVVARDQGPGIPDVEQALSEGYASGNGLGLGLPGAKRLMDDFSIETEIGRGTTVTMRKWRERDALERLGDRSRRHG
jgi:serine/threonine-protein kinase RsbT